jgi:hypothetical protein
MCGDISNTWTVPGTVFSMTLNQTGDSVTGTSVGNDTYADGTVVCAQGLNYTVSGSYSSANQTFTLNATSSAADNCGNSLTVDNETDSATLSCSASGVTMTTNQVSGSSPTSSPFPQFAAKRPTTTWTGTSNPPGITLSVDIMAGKVNTSLTGQKTDTLTVTVNNSQGTQAFNPITHSAQGATNPNAPINDSFRTLLPAGQYGTVTASWGTSGSASASVSFYMLGLTHFTQYNTPYHSQCSANPQFVWVVSGMDPIAQKTTQYCYYKGYTMGQQFIQQTGGDANGTGVDDLDAPAPGMIVMAYSAGAYKICPLIPGTDANHTFFAVDSGGAPLKWIVGSHWSTNGSTALSDGTGPGPGSTSLNNYNPQPGTVATDPKVTNKPGSLYQWGDSILLVDQNDQNDAGGLRSVQDLCPACTNQGQQTQTANAHIDVYNGTNPSCNASAVGDYGAGQYYAIRLR